VNMTLYGAWRPSQEPLQTFYPNCHALARAAIQNRFDKTWIVAKDHFGKPLVLNAKGREAAYVSVSHSGDVFVMAVSDQPIGIDLEIKTSFAGIQKIRRFFLDSESLETTDTESLSRIWVRKEALSKYLGVGMLIDFSCLLFSDFVGPGRLYFHDLELLNKQYLFSVVTGEKKLAIEEVALGGYEF
jgi:hypothetical protein